MKTALCVQNFLKFTESDSKILNDFIDLVRMHNPNWLPQFCLNLTPSSNTYKIMERIKDSLFNKYPENQIITGDRLGVLLPKISWANELLIYGTALNRSKSEIIFAVYPGNTKQQGIHIFRESGVPKIKDKIRVKRRIV